MCLRYIIGAEQHALYGQLAKQFDMWYGTVHLTYGAGGPPRFTVGGRPVKMTNKSLFLLREFEFGAPALYSARVLGRTFTITPPRLTVQTTVLIPRTPREVRLQPRVELHSTFMDRRVVVDENTPLDYERAASARHECFPFTEVWLQPQQ